MKIQRIAVGVSLVVVTAAVASTTTAQGVNRLFIVSLDPVTSRVVSDPAPVSQVVGGETVWSRDGRYLAYASSSAAGQRANLINILSVESGENRQIKPNIPGDLPSNTLPSWSPDGRSLVVDGGPNDPVYPKGLYRVDVETGQTTTLVSRPLETPVTEAKWLPDGRSLVFLENFCAIIKRNLDSGTETTLYDVRADRSRPCAFGQTDQIISLTLSPDGEQLAFRWFKRESQTSALVVMDASGGVPKEVATHHATAPRLGGRVASWSADGRHILFFDPTGPDSTWELWRVSATGGAPERLGLTAVNLYGPRPSPDGRHLLFATRPTGGGLFAIDRASGVPLRR